MIEHEVIFNGDLIIPPETRKLVIKSVRDDIHCGVAVTQKRMKLEAWWPGYSRDVKEYIKRCKKCKELRNFTQTTLHSWSREGEPWNCVHMDHAYITGGGLINTSILFFRLVWSNPCAKQEKFYNKTDSKGHILLKWHAKNPGIWQCTKILKWRS